MVSSAWQGGGHNGGEIGGIRSLAGSFGKTGLSTVLFGTLAGAGVAALAKGNIWAGAATGFVVSLLNHVAHENGWFEDNKEDPSKPCADCPLKEKFTHKNGEVFSSKNGNDYIFYDNKWHWITKAKYVVAEYRDTSDAAASIKVTKTREEAFIGYYLVSKAQTDFVKGGFGLTGLSGIRKIYDFFKNPTKFIKGIHPGWFLFGGTTYMYGNMLNSFSNMNYHNSGVNLIRSNN